MAHIFLPEISLMEKILRSATIYLFLLLAFRLTGKRQIGQLTPFDLIVLLIISNVVQNALIGKDDSLGGGIIGASTILLLNYVVVELTYRSRRARRILEARPTLLIYHGRILEENLRKERLTLDELHAALRKNGLREPAQVELAVLEENGGISVTPRPESSKASS